MSIIEDGANIRLEGLCRVEDAEPLTVLLQSGRFETVDISSCDGLHSAVTQALLVFGPTIIGEAADPFVRDWIAPALRAQRQPDQGEV
ncbi:hypothetical protein P7B02_11285 [Caulobacter segnis]|uniref:hypothetical protein n=1 Tax=Caulobacter segnis TaxID=88688 RepID=UPI00240FAF95|nr:hypothetical protein [Caulobacter segnis]MDG2522123.1 hypothetical protein [Caulobacter segnis]